MNEHIFCKLLRNLLWRHVRQVWTLDNCYMYLGNSIYAAQYDLVNVPVEEKSSLLAKDLLDEGIYSLQNLLRQLQSFTETSDSNG